jgi:glycosyltransferase involved in cell wall biosynthesis
MKVSVCITTYNHERYIAQAVESVLMQKTDFDFEIILGEDDSADGTREIVKKYKEQYPDRIRLFLNNRKNVIYINGRPTGRWNFMNNMRNARGDYIALLEGDDYWTEPYKLQKQADFLDANPECSMCFHDVSIFYEDKGEYVLAMPPVKKERYTIEDLLKGNFIHTCSVMFRRGLFGEFPDWFVKTSMGDWPLHILNAQHGDIGRLEEIMGVYRVHAGGLWGQKGRLHQVENTIGVYKLIDAHLGYRYKGIIRQSSRPMRSYLLRKRIGALLTKPGLKAVNVYRRIFYPESLKD